MSQVSEIRVEELREHHTLNDPMMACLLHSIISWLMCLVVALISFLRDLKPCVSTRPLDPTSIVIKFAVYPASTADSST